MNSRSIALSYGPTGCTCAKYEGGRNRLRLSWERCEEENGDFAHGMEWEALQEQHAYMIGRRVWAYAGRLDGSREARSATCKKERREC
ncbi:hypothetical protein Hypma_014582 [Hypsizygus marmoreus]|uniref:Uncharacterized protein n=1 Tax=Hypsizygus marmoreus TaxID=39966 RepID=A0A369JJ59_HYPMA|nr:hypothetical protein Hypma_014582 [Hypsizygus marmoreus]